MYLRLRTNIIRKIEAHSNFRKHGTNLSEKIIKYFGILSEKNCTGIIITTVVHWTYILSTGRPI